jgi:hypothetical protein
VLPAHEHRVEPALERDGVQLYGADRAILIVGTLWVMHNVSMNMMSR